MDKETQILKMYKDYIVANSTFGDKCLILPSTPQSFSKFPTIIIRERNNSENTNATTLNRIEYAENAVYQIDIYAKDITVGNTKYAARSVVNELKRLSFDFIRKLGYTRNSGTNMELLDVTVQRYVIVFTGIVKSWNTSI